MLSKTKNINKGIIFAGSSITWGQGLYFYSNLRTLTDPDPNLFEKSIVTNAHILYMHAVRFARLVSNHFQTFEMVKPLNGGSDEDSICFIKKCFGIDVNNQNEEYKQEKINFDDIEFIIFQTTDIFRNYFYYEYLGEKKKFRILDLKKDKKSWTTFSSWLRKNNYEFNEWKQKFLNDTYTMIKDELSYFESKGVKVLILFWQDEVNNMCEKLDNWFLERHIKISFNNKLYNTIKSLIDDNPSMSIISDYTNFITPPKDTHPSKLCHQIIATSIINKIENIKKII